MQDGEFYARLAELGTFKAERLGKEPSDRTLAARARLSPTTIGVWLSGNRFPDDVDQLVTVVRAIASAARVRRILAPDGLLDTEWWIEAHAAEKRRRDARRPDTGAPGRPLTEWTDPFALEVHPPVQAEDPAQELPDLPPYIPRDHDEKLAEVVRAARDGRSGIAVLVGGSSTGKTRACWEILSTLDIPNGSWRLWHPLSATPAAVALRDLPLIAPNTVIWLNEAQRYLDTRDRRGEDLAASLRELLRDRARGPVLILATLWPDDWNTLTVPPPRRGEPDPHAQARELLTGHRILVPPAFTKQELRTLAESSDPRLHQAAEFASDGKVTQFIAGVPELMSRYETAPAPAAALIHAAMDARRLGMGVAIGKSFLVSAAPSYLDDFEWETLDDDWLEQALKYTGKPCKGTRGPLSPIRPRPGQPAEGPACRLADYLEQHGRRERRAVVPPLGFWVACEALADPGELRALGDAAWECGLHRQAARLYKRAAVLGDAEALALLIERLQELGPGADRPAWRLAETVSLNDPRALARLLWRLAYAGAADQVSALLERGLVDRVQLDDPEGIALLLDVLQRTPHEKHIDVLLARDPVARVTIDHGAAYLFGILRFQGRIMHAARLGMRVAVEGSVRAPAVALKLMEMQISPGPGNGLPREFTRSFAGRLARHLPVDDRQTVAEALYLMHAAGAEKAAMALEKRARAHSPSNDPREFELRKEDYWELEKSAPTNQPPERDSVVNNEPDDTSAGPWGWDDLD